MKNGFTLVEISIGLVIIGLLIAGIVTGLHLIKSQEMRSIAKDWETFEMARITFKTKYKCIPGDCITANQFGLGTNGNQNHRVDYASTSTEHINFWVHLANAGLIEGTYSSTPAAGGTQSVTIGTNVPAAARTNVGYSVYQFLPSFNPWGNFMGVASTTASHFYITGSKPTLAGSSNFQTMGAAFSVVEAKSFDAKFDDGIASTGKVRSHKGYVPYRTEGCHDSVWPGSTSQNFDYNVSASNAWCSLAFMFEP